MISPAKRRDKYSLESKASEFRMKEGNIFAATAGSGLILVIAPTDKEFVVVNAIPKKFGASIRTTGEVQNGFILVS